MAGFDKTMAKPNALSASTIIGDSVVNTRGEDLGKIEEIMLDINSGSVAYAVLSFGGFLGLGDKLFAIPWSALTLDEANERFVLDIDKETLKNAPGFDKDNWPKTNNEEWLVTVYDFYGYEPYWK
jgi:sporulation protein YlmC with PRC-barrel domain